MVKASKYVVSALSVLATAAHADCPTRQDLKTGVRLGDPDGTEEIYRLGETPHVIEMTLMQNGVATYGVSLARGVYYWKLFEISDNVAFAETQTTWFYAAEFEDMPLPKFSDTWQINGVRKDPGGLRLAKQSWQSLSETVMKIGPCRYPAVPLVVDYPDDFREFLNYLPTLGFALLVAHEYGTLRNTFEYDRIEAMTE